MKVLDKDEIQVAEEVLKKHLPKSYKVYGFLFSINRGKPTTVEVIVDKWPDFKVIICRPDLANKRVMDYPLKVTIFSTDPHTLKDMLVQEGTLDWSQNFLFGGLDVSHLSVVRDVCSMKGFSLKSFTNISVHLMYLPDTSCLKSVERELESKMTSLDLSHVDLVNDTWKYGKNKQSHRLIADYISNFPSCCIKDEQGQPVSWIFTYNYWALGILYTVPEHRGRGYAKALVSAMAKRHHADGSPVYCFIEEDSTVSYKLFKSLGFIEDPSYRAAWYHVEV